MFFVAVLSETQPTADQVLWLIAHDDELQKRIFEFGGETCNTKIELRSSDKFSDLRFRPYVAQVRLTHQGQEFTYDKLNAIVIMNPEHGTERPTEETKAKFQFRQTEIEESINRLVADSEWSTVQLGLTTGGNAIYRFHDIDVSEFNDAFARGSRQHFTAV
uniref:Uncharacterized protein n=1 Tax=Pseudomonas phage HRDY3 TaxID=3236930 RepID=A0AB39CEJ2_9VIRU